MKDKFKLFATFFIVAVILNKAISMSPRALTLQDFHDEEKSKGKASYLKQTVEIDEQDRNIVKNPDDYLVLVNKDRFLPDGYEPQDLAIPDVDFSFKEDIPKRYLRKEAATQLEKLFTAAKKDGVELYASSGYRPYSRQVELYNSKVAKDGEDEAKRLVALPGQSEHQTGLAMDLTSRSIGFLLEEEFEDTKEGQWVKDNAQNFGFIIRYPKDKVESTKYSYEPWHLRYVGDDAKDIYKSNLSLEEYLEKK